MSRRHLFAALLLGLLLAPAAKAQVETELLARRRVFPGVGAGLRAIKRDASGRYYVLASPGPVVVVYNAAGERVGQVPAAASPGATLVYGDDLALDAAGRLCVADRAANAVKVYSPDGALFVSIPVAAPTSVAALGDGEIAVASAKSARLVTIFDMHGKVVREFGDPTEIADRRELNRFLNIGRLNTDAAGHLYYAFSFLPEPTVRKYDRYGYSAFEIALTALEVQPTAAATRREIQRQERGGTPALKPIVTAVGVDPVTEELWVALGGVLLHFDRTGARRGIYRAFTAEGARVEAVAILVEPDRLLLAADPLGIYEFPRPDKAQP